MAVLSVNCPSCQRIVPWTDESPYRPFCSLRCKQQDFCDWANERHAIPGQSDEEDELFSDELRAADLAQRDRE